MAGTRRSKTSRVAAIAMIPSMRVSSRAHGYRGWSLGRKPKIGSDDINSPPQRANGPTLGDGSATVRHTGASPRVCRRSERYSGLLPLVDYPRTPAVPVTSNSRHWRKRSVRSADVDHAACGS
ncbi:MAG: hypothetical protein NVS3B26_18780 [Mycobacteriales bacterium]